MSHVDGCRSKPDHEGICRDGKDRPRIVLPDPDPKGRPIVRSYSRSSNYGKVLEDLNQLMGWKVRVTVLGALDAPELLGRARRVKDNKDALQAVANQILDLGGASVQATRGTAVHRLTEYVDQAVPLEGLPPSLANDLRAYRNTADYHELEPLLIEGFCVQDDLRCAGTFDRLARMPYPCPECGLRTYIADLKTSRTVNYPHSWAVQLAIYSRSKLYDIKTTARTDMEVCQHRGLLIHLPAEQARCGLYWIDISTGWEVATSLVPAMKAWRARRDLLEEL